MNREAQILLALQSAPTLDEQRRLVAELDTIRTSATRRARVAREVELGAEAAAAHLTPAPTFVRHTASTDWLSEAAAPRQSAGELHQVAKAEASAWFRQTTAIARQNPGEMRMQASGYADVWASQFGTLTVAAKDSFLQAASRLAGMKLAAEDPEEEPDDPEESYEEADDDDDTDDGGNPFADDDNSKKEGRRTARRIVTARSLREIANEIDSDWGVSNVNYGARPYLEAMFELDSITDNYYEDSAKSIVAYFLSNAGSWKGETAKRIKAELKAMMSGKTAKDDQGWYEDGMTNSNNSGKGWTDDDPEGKNIPQSSKDAWGQGVEDRERLKAGEGSRRTAGEGMTCSVCGDAMTSTDGSYHHDNGEKHDHEAKPGKESSRKVGYTNSYGLSDEGPNGLRKGMTVYVEGVDRATVLYSGFDEISNNMEDGPERVKQYPMYRDSFPVAVRYPDGLVTVVTFDALAPNSEDRWGKDASLRTASLFDDADAAYERHDRSWFNNLSLGDLETLWKAVSGENFLSGVQTYGWDDEVSDALYFKGYDFGVTASRRTADLNSLSPDDLSAEQKDVEARYVGRRVQRVTDGVQGTVVAAEANTFGGNPRLTIEWDDGAVTTNDTPATVINNPRSSSRRRHAEADGIDSPSPQSQNGYAESTLPNVEVATAPEDTNMGWITEGDSNADNAENGTAAPITASMGVFEAAFMGKVAERDRATSPRLGDQTACKFCGLDIEFNDGWYDRGGNSLCPRTMAGNNGEAKRDQDGVLVPNPNEGKKHQPYSDRTGSRTAGLYPDENAKGVTTWADGSGVWHATADSTEEARKAIESELADRGEIDPQNYEVKVKLVDGRHYVEASRKVAAIPVGRSDYKPGQSRMGEATPQSDPDMFSSEDLLAEIKYLMKMNERLGSNVLRTMAYTKLLGIITDRGDVERLTPKSRKQAEVDSPSPDSQNGYGESTLTDVSVGSAPDDTNLGWIADGDPNAEDEAAFEAPDNPIANEASINARFARLVTAGPIGYMPEYRDVQAGDDCPLWDCDGVLVATDNEAFPVKCKTCKTFYDTRGGFNRKGSKTAGENDRPAGAAPMVDQITDDAEDDNDMFGGEWIYEGSRRQAMHPDDDPSQGPGYLNDAPNLLGDPPGMDPYDFDDYEAPDDTDMFAPEASRKMAMPAPADVGVSVGSIFYSSWGYDQTNVSFYEVVGLTPASVKVREVAKSFVSQNGPGGNKVIPQPGNYIGGEMTKRLQNSGYRDAAITINSSETAWLWDGNPQYETDSMYGH